MSLERRKLSQLVESNDLEGIRRWVQDEMRREAEAVNHPTHYNLHPSGVEAIDVCEFLSFNVGNAVKYLWRGAHKWNLQEDLRKAIWYMQRARQPQLNLEQRSVLVERVIAADQHGLLGTTLQLLGPWPGKQELELAERYIGSELAK